MNEQPEALRLAISPGAIIRVDIETTAALAAELRRLHEERTLLLEQNTELDAKLAQLEEANQELLDVILGLLLKHRGAAARAKAAIAKAGGAA